jgi:hypothetical protein
MRKSYSYGVAGLVTLLLAACGGGGGDSGSAVVTPPPVQVAPVAITSANAQVVASDSLWAGNFFGADLGNLTGLTAAGGRTGANMSAKLVKLASAGVSKTLSPVFEATLGPITEACLVSGTVTLTLVYTDLLTITAGDSITLDSVNCDDGDGQVMDGYLKMTFTAFSGNADTGVFLATVAVTVVDLSMDDGGSMGPVVMDGGFDMVLDTMSLPVTTATTSGDVLSMDVAGRQLTVVNFMSYQVADQGVFPTAYELSVSGGVRSNRFDGEATSETITPFASSGPDFPYAGEMLVTGAAGSTIRVIALDALNVRLEMDYNGDGAVDETVDMTWEEAIS